MLPALAQPLLDLAKRAESEKHPDPRELAATARSLVANFETEARRRKVPQDWLLDARDALVALLDARAQQSGIVDPKMGARACRCSSDWRRYCCQQPRRTGDGGCKGRACAPGSRALPWSL
ncbi:DotU family type IV/VI secretion system protein [Rhizobium beringeri]